MVLIGEPIPDAFAINTNFHAPCWIRGEKSSHSPREGRKARGHRFTEGLNSLNYRARECPLDSKTTLSKMLRTPQNRKRN